MALCGWQVCYAIAALVALKAVNPAAWELVRSFGPLGRRARDLVDVERNLTSPDGLVTYLTTVAPDAGFENRGKQHDAAEALLHLVTAAKRTPAPPHGFHRRVERLVGRIWVPLVQLQPQAGPVDQWDPVSLISPHAVASPASVAAHVATLGIAASTPNGHKERTILLGAEGALIFTIARRVRRGGGLTDAPSRKCIVLDLDLLVAGERFELAAVIDFHGTNNAGHYTAFTTGDTPSTWIHHTNCSVLDN